MSFARVRSFAHQSWCLLGKRSAASALVAWLYAPVGVWAAYVTNWLRAETPTGTWWIIVIVGQFVVVILLPLIGIAIHRWIEPRLRPAATFIGIVITIVVHNRSVDIVADFLNVSPNLDLMTTVASVVSQIGLLLIIAIRVSARSQEQREVDDLAHTQTSLTAEDEDLRVRVGDIDQRITIQIGLTIEPRIYDIDRQLAGAERGGNIAVSIDTLRSFVDDELLPLSHRLADAVTPLSSDTRPSFTGKRSVKMVSPQHLSAGVFIRPWLTTGVIGLLAIPSMVSRLPLIDALLVTLALVGVFGVVLFVSRKLLRRLSFPVMGAFVASALLSGGASLLAVVVLSGPLALMQQRSLVISFAIGFALGILSAIAAIQDERFALTKDSLVTQIESLEDSTSTLRQQLWVSRRRFGYALHGGLQGALQASMLRLLAAEQPTAELIAEVRAEIRRAFVRATEESHEPPNLALVCAELGETWAGACEITWDIPEGVSQVLGTSRIGAECSAEVIRETVQNSVRHGQASRVQIAAEVDDARLVLFVFDDGTWKEGGGGLGSRMLDEFCSRWAREPVDFGTRVRAEIVIPAQSRGDHGIEYST